MWNNCGTIWDRERSAQLEGMGCDLNYKITDLKKVRVRFAKDEARAIGYQLMVFKQI
jgi:hypothetical protein